MAKCSFNCAIVLFLGLILILLIKEGSTRSHNDRERGEKSAGIFPQASGLIVKIPLRPLLTDFSTSYATKSFQKIYVVAEI